jgi:hypothetical protein
MTLWSPEYRIKANGSDVTGITLVGFTISSGRKDINASTEAGYCNLTLINTDNSYYAFTVNTAITVEVKDASGDWVVLFGGRISDISFEVNSAGSTAVVTRINIIALGALFRLQRALFDGNLTEDLDGDQILQLLSELLLNNWNEVPPAETWANYDPTVTWANAEDVGLGEIDAGEYTMVSRQITDSYISGIANSIAQSAGGYLYEDASGNIGYADASHRQDYLVANGYTDLDANHALSAGIASVARQGDIVNKVTIDYGNNFNNSYTAQDTSSQSTYGLYAEQLNSYIKNQTDAEDFADRVISLRAFPRERFQSITFPVHSTEIDDTDRDALLNVFMGLPIRLNNLPPNISLGQFEGFVEGWTWRSTVNGLFLTLTASPTAYNAVAQQWAQVNAAETWNSILNTLEWQDAIGVIS